MNSRWIISVFSLLLGIVLLLAGCGSEPTLTQEEASEFIGSYIAAVARGDSAEVLGFWSKEAQARKGFWVMPVAIGQFDTLSAFSEWVRDYTFEVTGVKRFEDYHIINFDWIPKASATGGTGLSRHKMKHYVVFENGRPVLGSPMDVLTRDWQVHESDCFVFHYPRSVSAEDCLWEMDLMDAEARNLVRFLGARLSDKIDFYRPVSMTDCGALINCPPSYAFASTDHNCIISTDFINAHELIHLLTLDDVDFASAAFSEGIAVALGGGAWYNSDYSMSLAKTLLGHPMYIPLREMLLADDTSYWKKANVTYHESGAFVRFLLDQYGMDKLLVLQSSVDSIHQLPDVIQRIYGRNIEELEEDWHSQLQNLSTPEVGCTVPAEAEMVFSMNDQPGDDVGDGDYVYPKDERFVPGMFDIIGFDLLKDDESVFFRVRLRDLAEPVTNTSTGMTYTTGITIALRRGDEFSGRLQKNCHGIVFGEGEGYDFRMDVGRAVCLVDNLGKAFYLTPDISDSMIIREDNVIQFSLPLSVTGVPQNDWEILVGAYLLNDYGLGFLRGGPEQIQHRAGEFAVGGGEDVEYSPKFIDILLSEGVDQAEILGSYDAGGGRRAVVPMLSLEM